MGKCKPVPAYIPHELLPIAKRRQREERLRSLSAYIVSCLMKDIIEREKHEITAPLLSAPREVLDEAVEMIVRDFSKLPRASSQWLRARIEELLKDRPEL